MVKEKQTRTYDPDGFRRRAACLCVRDPSEGEILLVTSSRMTDHWIVPGGGVEPNEDASDAAIRETEEEAGVRGIIKRCLGDIEVRDENRERKHRTSVYVLEVSEELNEWEDCKARLRQWFPIEEAIRLLSAHKPIHCTYITLMIQTSSSLKQSAPRLLALVASLLEKHQLQQTTTSTTLPNSLINDGPSSAVNSITSSADNPPTTTNPASNEQRYLQVNYYPSGGGNGNSNSLVNAHFNAFICSRGVYSTDSDTAEDLIGGNSTNHHHHFGEGGGGGGGEAENGNVRVPQTLATAAESSVNS